MKSLLRLEELLMFAFSLYLFSGLDASWGLFALLFFTPDLSMLGYLANPRLGAWTYNLIHHKGTWDYAVCFRLPTDHPLADLRRHPILLPLQLRPHHGVRLKARRCLPEHAFGEDREIILIYEPDSKRL
jgi:hypothetical protein